MDISVNHSPSKDGALWPKGSWPGSVRLATTPSNGVSRCGLPPAERPWPQRAAEADLRVLLIEDNGGDADLVAEYLEDSHLEIDLSFTPRLSDALLLLEEASFDCVLLDLGLPDVRGTETVRRFRRQAPDVPLVVLTGVEDAAIASMCVRLGAQEFLEKDLLGPRALAQAIELARLRVIEARVRRELVQADRLRSMGLLAAGIAHEVNNPLTVVQMNLEALAAWVHNDDDDDPTTEVSLASSIDESLDAATRMSAIVGRLNAFARQDDQPRTLVDLERVVRDARRLTEHRWRRRCRFRSMVGPTPPVLGRPSELTQVLVNLFLNATQALEGGEGGTIQVSTRVTDEWVELRVEDDGPGMTPRVLRRIFDPFFTTKGPDQGTGLGLALCRDIVEGHGGTLDARSIPGSGSTFRVGLPIAVVDECPPPPETVAEAPGRRRILVADDEPHLLRVMARLLGREHEVTTALGGEAAVTELATGRHFDIVICDLVMPKTGGGEVYEWVCEHRPELESRFVLMSGGAAHSILATLPDVRRLGKPFDRAELHTLIAKVTGEALDEEPPSQ